MDASEIESEQFSKPSWHESSLGEKVVLAGATLIALLSASCCVIPIGLAIIGLGGTWLSFLGPFVVYRIPILIIVSPVVGYLWLRMLKGPKTTRRTRLSVFMVSLASFAILLAWSAPLWEWELSNVLLDIWTSER